MTDPETQHPPHLRYRPEIDGLRAIAVLGVVLFHFGIPDMLGGFVGVDVFFVISGFLIGSLLWIELTETGRLRLGRFYLRRVRRLAPAYFAMAAASSVAAWFVLLPFEFMEFGKELIASTLWMSNVLFFKSSGYFDIGSQSKLLLHTWSLSVEEQFYLVLPLLLLTLKRSRQLRVGVLVVAWLASLFACVALTPTMPAATFYLFPLRAWELLSGVLIAVWGIETRTNRRLSGSLSWIGVVLIIGAITETRESGFPGWQALFPVVGSAFILINGQHQNVVNRVLATRVPRFFGKISYSLYLWHWPVLILSRYWRDGYSGPRETAFWLALAVLLATLSWRFVEQPFRRPRAIDNRGLLVGAVLAAVTALGFGALAYKTNGLAIRFPLQVRVLTASTGDWIQDWSRCHTPGSGPFAGINICPIGPEGPPQVIFWGDSHLRAMDVGLSQLAQERKVSALIIWRGGCPPLFGISKTESAVSRAEDAACRAQDERMRLALAEEKGVSTIVLIGRWAYYAEGGGVGRDAHNKISLEPLPGSDLADPAQIDLYDAAWNLTITDLSKWFPRVFVMRQVPEIPFYDSRELARRLVHGHLTPSQAKALYQVDEGEVEKRARRAEEPLHALAQAGKITLINTWPAICTNGVCSAMHDGKSWYFDNSHLNNTGSAALRSIFGPVFDAFPR